MGRLTLLGVSSGVGGEDAGGGVVDSPDDVAGLWTWLKADAITGLSDGDPIGTWEDSSANNKDATQATAGRKPTYKTGIVNGLPVVRFDVPDISNADFMALPNASALTAGTVFIVVKIDADPTSSQKDGLWKLGSDASNDTHYAFSGDGTIYDHFGTTSRKTTNNPASSLAAWRIYTVLSKSGEWTSWFEETQFFTTATNTVGFTTAPLLGNGTVSSNYLDGDVAEFILYDNDIGSTNRTAIWDYLQAKYAL